MNALIPRNTTIPTSKSQVYTTADDNQTSVEIHVLQGERPMAADNKSIGRFILDGILAAPRGLPKIEVTFDIDANGILSVQAKDQATGREQKIVIQASSGLAEGEIDQLIKDAEQNAEDDLRKREEADLKNSASQMVYAGESLIKENEEKIPEEIKSEVQEKLASLRQALSEENLSNIRTGMDELSSSMQKVGSHIYQNASPETPEDTVEDLSEDVESGESTDTDETVEGEFRQV